MSDHFDHYKRPPSRDSSVDRYSRAASRLANSRQPSVDKPLPSAAVPTSESNRSSRAGSMARAPTPAGNGAAVGAGQPAYMVPSTPASPQPPFEDIILRKRGLGQDMVPSPLGQPKRTESLYVAAARKEPPPPKVSLKIFKCSFKITFYLIYVFLLWIYFRKSTIRPSLLPRF